jgi:glutathione peroxidase
MLCSRKRRSAVKSTKTANAANHAQNKQAGPLWRLHGMTFRQRFLKLLYPFIMRLSRSTKGRVLRAPQNRERHAIPPMDLVQNNGTTLSTERFKGQKTLLVNTASDCGYTGQYENLQKLADRFGTRIQVIGIPSNDFKEQEKANDDQIAAFCTRNYGVEFPILRKAQVLPGKEQHPLFQWLSQAQANGWNTQAPEWNFSKYLLNEEGQLEAYFGPAIDPLDPEITQHLDA